MRHIVVSPSCCRVEKTGFKDTPKKGRRATTRMLGWMSRRMRNGLRLGVGWFHDVVGILDSSESDPGVCSTQVRSMSPIQSGKASSHADHRELVPRLLPVPLQGILEVEGRGREVVDYEAIQTEADARFREQAIERLMAEPRWRASSCETLLR